MERNTHPSVLQVTKDLLDHFAAEIPSSMPEGWTANVLVSLVANKTQLTDYGPYYNYCIEKSSEGESSLDKESKTSISSNESFEVFFPTIRDLLDYYVDPRLCDVTRDNKLAENKQPTEVMMLEDAHVDEHPMEKALKVKGYAFTKSKNDCIYKGIKYIRYGFSTYKIANKAYKLLSNEFSLEQKLFYLIRRPKAYIPPSIILRNVPENITLEELTQKIKEVTKIDILDYVKPFKLRETYNTIVSAKSIKDCQVICYFMHKKNVFYKSETTKCCIHPQSQRTPFDTNFTEYLRNGAIQDTFSQLIPHWTTINKPPPPNPPNPASQSQQGQITLQHFSPAIRKPSYRRSHS